MEPPLNDHPIGLRLTKQSVKEFVRVIIAREPYERGRFDDGNVLGELDDVGKLVCDQVLHNVIWHLCHRRPVELQSMAPTVDASTFQFPSIGPSRKELDIGTVASPRSVKPLVATDQSSRAQRNPAPRLTEEVTESQAAAVDDGQGDVGMAG
jgi:hypothetical protein